jgi:S-adenosylmethionine decarboxylase
MTAQLDHFKSDGRGNYYAGDHLLVELWDASRLSDPAYIQNALESAARAAGATVLYSYFHPFGEGMGVSGVSILAESHISIHTWPERAYAAIDVFMCGSCDPQKTVPVLEAAFTPGRVEAHQVRRGLVLPEAFQSVA